MADKTVDELRRTSFEMAQAIAPGWERRRAFVEEVTAPVRAWLIRELQPRPGATVLELAAGAGDTGFEAAALVGANGRLISSDFAPAMVEVARRRGRELGVGNVDYRVIDAQRIELGAASVDGVVCRYGYMLMVDPAAALAETRRVLRPGGRLALAVWGAPERNPFFAALGMTLVQASHMPPPDPEGPGVFSLASGERVRGLLEGAGFSDPRIEEVPVRFAFEDVGEYVSIAADTAGPIALALRGLSDDERAALAAKLEEVLTPFAAAAGYEVPGVALCAAAS
jgi:SAM-dependent methyltransferase